MVANHHYTRIDTMELKSQIYQKIGQRRAEKYFDQLKKLFSCQMGKVEFDKVCVRTIGKENVALHNRLIRSIVKNACLASTPPKIRKVDGSLIVKVANGYQRTCLQSLYGDALPQSPRKSRIPVYRSRKCTDRPSPLGPLGKSPSTITGKSPSVITEEGNMRAIEQQSATEVLSVGSRPPLRIVSVEEGEEVEQYADCPSVQSKGPVTAPFGVSLNNGTPRKALWNNYRGEHYVALGNHQRSDFLPDTLTLRNRLEKRLQLEGVGVSMDAANLLNRGLDVYMKRLIESCMGVARSRSGGENAAHSQSQCMSTSSSGGENAAHSQSQCMSTSSGTAPLFYPQKPSTASMLDFHVAMETNPRILGQDWPLQLEKICFCASEQ